MQDKQRDEYVEGIFHEVACQTTCVQNYFSDVPQAPMVKTKAKVEIPSSLAHLASHALRLRFSKACLHSNTATKLSIVIVMQRLISKSLRIALGASRLSICICSEVVHVHSSFETQNLAADMLETQEDTMTF